MPSIRALKQAIIGPSIAQQHESLLATITDREQRLREAPGLKRSIGDRREQIRANESRLVKLNGALRGYVDSKQWGRHEADTREEIATLKEENVRLSEAIAADEKVIADLATFTLPVSADVLRHHREQVTAAQANVGKIAAALEIARGELHNIEAASDPIADLRRRLSEALAAEALGGASADEIGEIEAQIAARENVASATGIKAERLRATVAGLQGKLSAAEAEVARLNAVTPALRLEALRPELEAAEAAYGQAVASLVSTFDRVRALRHLHSAIRPDSAFNQLPDAAASCKDAGQLRLGEAVEKEQARLESLGF